MTIDDRIRALADHMSTQLRIKGEGFQDIATKAGRKIPRRHRADVAAIADAETLVQNPKLARRIDEARFTKAERRLQTFLDTCDPKAERRGEMLDLVAKIAFIIVTVVLAVFFYLISIGYFD